jgi:hypothetical protein
MDFRKVIFVHATTIRGVYFCLTLKRQNVGR